MVSDTSLPQLDTVIRGGHVFTDDDEGFFDIGIRGGSIAAIASAGSLEAARILDATGGIVVPGGIDPHTHIEWPLSNGQTSRDTFANATRRAASWGTTTILDFVPARSGSLLRAADERLTQAADSVIDYSLHPIITELTNETVLEVPQLIDMGLASFKVYTTYESRLESPDIKKFVRLAGEAGGLPGFHAEHHGLLTDALKNTKNFKSVRINNFPDSRPAKAEVASIREVSGYAKEVGCPVYIYHVSGSDALAEVELSRSTGVDVRAETCTHYLVYEDSVYDREDGWKYVITPPIRSHDDRERLWRAVAAGRLEGVASDHCAYSMANKAAGLRDFTAMEPGAPGIASRMPLLWHHGVTRGRISVREFVEINSRRPAAALGLQQKGRIAIGADADIVIWDPSLEWTWDSQTEGLSNGSDYDIYHGLAGLGAPRTTLSRGRIVHGQEASTSSGGGALVRQIISV